MCYRMFGNARFLMHNYHLPEPSSTLRTWLYPAWGVYPTTNHSHEHNVPKNPILTPTALGDFCVILYFVRHPIGRQCHGSLRVLAHRSTTRNPASPCPSTEQHPPPWQVIFARSTTHNPVLTSIHTPASGFLAAALALARMGPVTV